MFTAAASTIPAPADSSTRLSPVSRRPSKGPATPREATNAAPSLELAINSVRVAADRSCPPSERVAALEQAAGHLALAVKSSAPAERAKARKLAMWIGSALDGVLLGLDSYSEDISAVIAWRP